MTNFRIDQSSSPNLYGTSEVKHKKHSHKRMRAEHSDGSAKADSMDKGSEVKHKHKTSKGRKAKSSDIKKDLPPPNVTQDMSILRQGGAEAESAQRANLEKAFSLISENFSASDFPNDLEILKNNNDPRYNEFASALKTENKGGSPVRPNILLEASIRAKHPDIFKGLNELYHTAEKFSPFSASFKNVDGEARKKSGAARREYGEYQNKLIGAITEHLSNPCEENAKNLNNVLTEIKLIPPKFPEITQEELQEIRKTQHKDLKADLENNASSLISKKFPDFCDDLKMLKNNNDPEYQRLQGGLAALLRGGTNEEEISAGARRVLFEASLRAKQPEVFEGLNRLVTEAPELPKNSVQLFDFIRKNPGIMEERIAISKKRKQHEKALEYALDQQISNPCEENARNLNNVLEEIKNIGKKDIE